ncbi:hypothetical protein NP856_02085 [Pseudomonas sp. 17391]|uniref:hypothetical protein n=1 Tax=Pseudomonas sp. 17391 TaxID=2967217 RepID=UPI0023644EF1|nr:hypothetical protein [Pseudomonas sp. 17391]MDD2127948.1 hypothetical protein [Pseudomonas sp. 17391]
MVIENRLRGLEVARRRALWALADLRPGDVRAEPTLLELDEIDQAQHELLSGDVLSSQELIHVIKTQLHNGIRLVIEDSIPEPWRQRFEAASIGCTRLGAGPYLVDFERFALAWHAEMEHLKAHLVWRDGRRSMKKDDYDPG